MSHKPDFETMFSPQSVAIIGASASAAPGPNGANFIESYRQLGFKGRIYPVNPKAGEINGLRAYPTVGSIPETVDLAILSIPAKLVPQILVECADAGVKNVQIFTAGFRETGEAEGIELEKQLKAVATARGLSVIGPNCMGLYVPKSGIGTWLDAPKESGPVGLISQSGGVANEYSRYAHGLGIRFSKVISIGNATVLDSPDFLEYFAEDAETKIINMYLEGIGDGRKLTKLVRQINQRKPVIILKGGLTESGARAVASHTGSLAGSEAIWDAFFRQTGAVRANSFEELMDVTMTFLFLIPMHGRRIALLGGGGGMSVAGADACAREGLETPTLSQETLRGLREYVPEAGFSIRNPLDVGLVLRDTILLDRTLKLLGADPKIDGYLINLMIGMGWQRQWGNNSDEDYANYVGRFSRENGFRKPLAVVLRSPGHNIEEETARLKLQALLVKAGVAVYPSLPRAAAALGKFAKYHEFLKGGD